MAGSLHCRSLRPVHLAGTCTRKKVSIIQTAARVADGSLHAHRVFATGVDQARDTPLKVSRYILLTESLCKLHKYPNREGAPTTQQPWNFRMASPDMSVNKAILLENVRNLLAASKASPDCSQDLWAAVSSILANHYGFCLFTVLSFSPSSGAQRIYTTRPDLHPLGKRQPVVSRRDVPALPPPKRGQWQHRVLVEGKPWVGSVRGDLRDVFEDWELLWENGLGSVLNVPIRLRGETIGSLNLLDREHAYDTADLGVAEALAKLLAPELDRARECKSTI